MLRSFSCKGSSSVSVNEAKSASRKASQPLDLRDMTEKEEEVPFAEYFEKKGKGKRFRSFMLKWAGKKKKFKVGKKQEKPPAVAFDDLKTAGTKEETSLAPLGVEDDDNDNDDDGIVQAARSPPPPPPLNLPVVRGGGAPRMPKRGWTRASIGRAFFPN